MKKLNCLFCLAILLATTTISLNGQTQLKKWYMNGKSIDFTENPPLVENMDFTPSVGFNDLQCYNGIYGPDKNLLLYV